MLVDAMRDERQLATWGTLLIAALARDFDTAYAAADAGRPSTGGSWGVALWHPAAAAWRADPRFRKLVERLQMPAYWREAGSGRMPVGPPGRTSSNATVEVQPQDGVTDDPAPLHQVPIAVATRRPMLLM